MSAQTDKDTVAVLLKCIELPVMKTYMPLNGDGSLKPIHIIQYPVSFSADKELLSGDKKIIFMSPSEIKANSIEAYIAFRSLKIEESTATANLNLFNDYNYETMKFKMTMLFVVLKKTGGIWNVISSTAKE
jgi:hypothetical protein